MVRLRGGRGPKDDTTAQLEFLAQRSKDSQDKVQPWTFGPIPSYVPRATNVGLDTIYWLFHPCEPVAVPTKLRGLRISVTANPSSSAQIALFTMAANGLSLRQIPASYVTVDGTATAVVSARFTRDIVIQPNQRVFVGLKAVGAIFNSAGVNVPNTLRSLLYTGSATDNLPNIAEMSKLTAFHGSIVWLIYLSPDAYEIL